MPRRSRLGMAGLPLHMIQRGNNRSACFVADDDYRFYLQHLSMLARKHGCAVHAYVLMTNHVHLLLTPSRANSATLLMKHLGQRYVQYFNKTYRRSGTLWEGRVRSSLVQAEDYLLRCYRFIEMNPVRAMMVNHPGEYPWSSYGRNACGVRSAVIVPHECYEALGRDQEEQQGAYAALFRTDLDADEVLAIRVAVNGGTALGNDRFREEIERALGRRAVSVRGGRPEAASVPPDPRQQEMSI